MKRYLSCLRVNRGRRARLATAMVYGCLLLLPTTSVAAGREAVKKAIAATVAVEWRPAKNAAQPPAAQGATLAEGQETELAGSTEQHRVRYFQLGLLRQTTADLELASGVVVSPDGLVVVVGRDQGEGAYSVYLEDGRKLSAKLLVDDRRTGLRLLKIGAQGLSELVPQESPPDVGDQAFAAYCTDRRGRAAAQGMIAARQRPAFGGRLQLDISVGRMSAGGPVVDGDGRLVGILSDRQPGGPANDAATYALPADAVRALLQFRHAERLVVLHRGMLGIQVDVERDGDRERLIAHPMPGSPASTAGIHEGDELVAIDGEKVLTAEEVVAAVARHALGETATVTVLREGHEQKIDIAIGPAPAQPDAAAGNPLPAVQPGANIPTTNQTTVNVVRPEQVYVLTQDGKTVAVAATKEQLEPFRNAARALRLPVAPGAPGVVPPSPAGNILRVERSDLEIKLEELGSNLQTLQQQVVTLTDEIKALRAKLAEEKK